MVPHIYGTPIVRLCHVPKRLRELYLGEHILIVNTDIEKAHRMIHTYRGVAAAYISII